MTTTTKTNGNTNGTIRNPQLYLIAVATRHCRQRGADRSTTDDCIQAGLLAYLETGSIPDAIRAINREYRLAHPSCVSYTDCLPDTGVTDVDPIASQEASAELTALLATLTDDQRQLIDYYITMEQPAREVGIELAPDSADPEGYVYLAWHRLRKELATQLK